MEKIKNICSLGFGSTVYDIQLDGRKQVFSHVEALNLLNFKISQVYDKYPSENALKFCSDNNISLTDNINKIYPDIDILIVALPTSEIDVAYEFVERFNPRMVVLEKPISYSSSKTIRIFELLNSREICFYVNYQRNFDKGYEIIRKEILLNKVITANFETTTAVAQGSSHMIELVLSFFPEYKILKTKSIKSIRVVNGVEEPGGWLVLSNGDSLVTLMMNSSSKLEGIFRGRIVFENYEIIFDEGNQIIEKVFYGIGNDRLGKIRTTQSSKIIYNWGNEEWILGTYKRILENKTANQEETTRWINVSRIIEQIMEESLVNT